MSTYYDTLGIDRNASPQQIKVAYRNLMKHHHPDLHENSEEATERAQNLNKAYAVLKDPVQRYEYDNLLMLQRNPVDPLEDLSLDLSEDGLSISEVPQYVCEGCGRHDPTLRVTIFIWVVSLILTLKRGWGRILCSRCRLKYSILWNIEVWFAGWWGIPYGPPHTIEALMKNSTGGIQPEENNATLLAALADDFYHQHRYLEAYQALQTSLKLRMSKSGLEFLQHLKQLIHQDHSNGVLKDSQSLHPLIFHIPILTVLFILSLSFITSVFYPLPEIHQNIPAQIPVNETMSTTHDIPASNLGVSLDIIEQALQICRNSRTSVASHIVSQSPTSTTEQTGEAQPVVVTLNWTKLDEQLIHQQTENTRIAFEQASPEIQKLAPIDAEDLSSVDKSSLTFSQDLHSKFNEMLSIYFNCAILEYGTTLVKRYSSSQGTFPRNIIDNIRQLGLQPDIAAWLKQVQLDSAYNQLIETVTKTQMEDGRYNVMTGRLTTLRGFVRDDSAVMANLSRKLEYYKNTHMIPEYNQVVAIYNQRIPQTQAHIQEYNDYLQKYNEFVGSLKDQGLITALHACLNQNVLFPEAKQEGSLPRQ